MEGQVFGPPLADRPSWGVSRQSDSNYVRSALAQILEAMGGVLLKPHLAYMKKVCLQQVQRKGSPMQQLSCNPRQLTEKIMNL